MKKGQKTTPTTARFRFLSPSLRACAGLCATLRGQSGLRYGDKNRRPLPKGD